jgi:hypothetical protein
MFKVPFSSLDDARCQGQRQWNPNPELLGSTSHGKLLEMNRLRDILLCNESAPTGVGVDS